MLECAKQYEEQSIGNIPNATSGTIMTTKPPQEAMSLLSLNDAGISSEHTTAIIAPAEKVRAIGNAERIFSACTTPKTPEMAGYLINYEGFEPGNSVAS